MWFSSKPIPHYLNNQIETDCYSKSDDAVLQWLNCTLAYIRRLENAPDPAKDPSTALAQLRSKATILEGVCRRRAILPTSTGTSLEINEKKRKLSQSTSTAAKLCLLKPKMISVGTQTDPWICPDCNGNPDLDEELFVFNELACDENYVK